VVLRSGQRPDAFGALEYVDGHDVLYARRPRLFPGALAAASEGGQPRQRIATRPLAQDKPNERPLRYQEQPESGEGDRDEDEV
jgi:hypothetical protein